MIDSRRHIVHHIAQAIEPLYGGREAEAIARAVLCERLKVNFSQLVADYDAMCDIEDLESVVEQLSAARPVQYLLGVTEFCGHRLAVREGVLIPRPETEELVERVLHDAPRGARILDVGTGSGAIAIALAAQVEQSHVVAVDISDTALEIAAENVANTGARVELVKADALGDLSHLGTFDIIVSNPPYIPRRDMPTMHRNVVDYEPHEALFVPDDDALCFYRSIARNALAMLSETGWLWFEIYEASAEDVCCMLLDMGFSYSGWYEDANLKPRVVWARR